MRVFAGPNGSGKSTIIGAIQDRYQTGIYVNADDIEKAGKENGFISLAAYGVSSGTEQFESFVDGSTLARKAEAEGRPINLSLVDNQIRLIKT